MKRTNESGRSMVEMLGVLAIIGVLSIGGIAGYSMAMNRYRANEALDIANKYAVIVFAGNQTNKAMGGSSYTAPTLKAAGLTTNSTGNKTPGGETISNVQIFDDAVQLKIEFTSEGVCKAAKSILGASSTSGTTSTGESCTDAVSCDTNGGSITYCFKQS